MQLECKQSFTNFFMIFFFYVEFAFFGVIIKTPSSGQNCHEVNQSCTLPMMTTIVIEEVG